MIKKLPDPEGRIQFYDLLAEKKMALPETVKMMRAIVGMTQPQYAKFVGVAPRIIIDLERGVGNPTLETLKKIGKPFRLDIYFR